MLGNETKELEAAWETGRTLMARLLVLTYILLKRKHHAFGSQEKLTC